MKTNPPIKIHLDFTTLFARNKVPLTDLTCPWPRCSIESRHCSAKLARVQRSVGQDQEMDGTVTTNTRQPATLSMWTILITAHTRWKMYTFITCNLMICLRRIFFWHLTKTKLNIWSTRRSARHWMQQVKWKVVDSLLSSFRKHLDVCFCQELSYITNRGSQTTASFHLFFVACWTRLKYLCCVQWPP